MRNERQNNLMLTSKDIFLHSPIAADLADGEVELLHGRMNLNDYRSGELIAASGDGVADSLYLLVSGGLEIRVQSREGLNSFNLGTPGDLANVIAFAGGGAAGVSTALRATGETRVLSLSRSSFEELIFTHPLLVYRMSQALVRYIHGVACFLSVDLDRLAQRIACPIDTGRASPKNVGAELLA